MQEFVIDITIISILVLGFLAFLISVVFGLFRFSKHMRFKIWSIGWIIYTLGIGTTILSVGLEIVLIDSFGVSGMLLGSLLLIDGNNETIRRGRELFIYFAVVVAGVIITLTSIILNLQYGTLFSISGFVSTYACWSSAMYLHRSETIRSLEYWILISGFSIWGFSTTLFPLLLFSDISQFLVFLNSVSIILTGSGMLAYFIYKKSESLNMQYEISQLLSGVLNHDVRNYVGSLQTAIEYANASESDRETWLELATEIVGSLSDFILEMREIMAATTRFEVKEERIVLLDVLNEVATRVAREYILPSDKLRIEVEPKTVILSNSIVKELLWNISDNAFKHKSSDLVFNAHNVDDMVILQIIDQAGGMPPEVQDFLNNPESLSSPVAPGMGLGLLLIRGLSLLCNVQLDVKDNTDDTGVIGTIVSLGFKRSIVTQTDNIEPIA